MGKFYGHTVPLVEEKIQGTRGGLLFIDEACALVDNTKRDGSFALEVIETVMSHMTSRTCTFVLAGYRDKMKELVDVSAGFKRRIGFFIDLPDMSASDIVTVAKRDMDSSGCRLGDDVGEEKQAWSIISSVIDKMPEEYLSENNATLGRDLSSTIRRVKIEGMDIKDTADICKREFISLGDVQTALDKLTEKAKVIGGQNSDQGMTHGVSMMFA